MLSEIKIGYEIYCFVSSFVAHHPKASQPIEEDKLQQLPPDQLGLTKGSASKSWFTN